MHHSLNNLLMHKMCLAFAVRELDDNLVKQEQHLVIHMLNILIDKLLLPCARYILHSSFTRASNLDTLEALQYTIHNANMQMHNLFHAQCKQAV